MIQAEDILSIEFIKKTEYHGCCEGMRYRLEKADTNLLVTVWPEPFNFFTTPKEQKKSEVFSFDEDGISDAIRWMNNELFEHKEFYDRAKRNWTGYTIS